MSGEAIMDTTPSSSSALEHTLPLDSRELGVSLVVWDAGRERCRFPIGQFSDERKPIHIGRGPGPELNLEDDGVSRLHARIVRTGDKFRLEDLGSLNGTRVNGRALPTRGSRVLRDGDWIQVGRAVLRFLSPARAASLEGESARSSPHSLWAALLERLRRLFRRRVR